MKQLEHTEQVTLMQWWALAHQQFGIPEQLLFAIPNGGERNVIVASKLKAEDRPSASQAPRSAIGCAQGRAEGRPSASQARNRAPIFRERLLEEALRDETAKCFINIKKERCTERVIDDRTTTIREAICIGSQYSSSTAHSCVNK